MLGAALLVSLLALPAPELISNSSSLNTNNSSLGSHVKCSCTTKSLEIDCECDKIPVLKSIGFDADIDVTNYEIDVDIIFDGKKYQILHLSAHNPQVCIDEIVVAKVCAKVENLEWSDNKVTGTLYLGVGIAIVGTKWFKITDLNIPFMDEAVKTVENGVLVEDAASVVGAPKIFGCNKLTDCKSCVEKNLIIEYPCYWCEIDSACHDVGSLESACTPASADDKCISLSTYSNCAMKNVSSCPA